MSELARDVSFSGCGHEWLNSANLCLSGLVVESTLADWDNQLVAVTKEQVHDLADCGRFAEQLLHAAGSNYYFTDTVMGRKPPVGEDPKRDQYKTRRISSHS